MKEIKFRAWDKAKRIYTYFTLSDINNNCLTNKKGCVTNLKFLEITEFMGIKDKNDKEIYEGDIVKMSCWEERKLLGDIKKNCEGIFVAEVELDWFGYEANFSNISGYHCPTHLMMHDRNPFEIIGNINENPELVKEAKKCK